MKNNCKDTKMYNKETQITTETKNNNKKDEEQISNRRKLTKTKKQKKDRDKNILKETHSDSKETKLQQQG